MEYATSATPINASKWITASVLNANCAQILISAVPTCHLGAINAAKGSAQAAQTVSILKVESAQHARLSRDAKIRAVVTEHALSVIKGFSKITGLVSSARQ